MFDTSTHVLTERQRFWLEHLRPCDAEGKATAVYAHITQNQELIHKAIVKKLPSRFLLMEPETEELGPILLELCI